MRYLVNIIAAASMSVVLCGAAQAQAPSSPEARVKALNLVLPPGAAPAANFVNSVQAGKLLFLSGNTGGAAWAGKGKVGKDLTTAEGAQAARAAGLIMLTKIRTALGSLDRVKRVVKVLGMVNSADGFGEQPQVDGVVQQLEDKLRRGLVRDAKLLPVDAVIRLGPAQVQQQPMAELTDGHRRFAGQIFQHRRRRGITQQIKSAVHQREQRLAVEKFHLRHGMAFAIRQNDVMRK